MFKIKSCYTSLDGKSVFYVADTSYCFKPEETDKYQFIMEYQDIYLDYPKVFVLTPDTYKYLRSCFGEYKESFYDRYTVFNRLSKLKEEFRYFEDVKHSQLADILYPVIFTNAAKSDILHAVIDVLIDKAELKDSYAK